MLKGNILISKKSVSRQFGLVKNANESCINFLEVLKKDLYYHSPDLDYDNQINEVIKHFYSLNLIFDQLSKH